MSTVRLFVLGLVYEHDVHGYEVKAVAKLWGVERWAKIGFGSIYHALGKLQAEGLIQERAVEQSGPRPRFVYAVTDAGRAAFLTLLRETLRSPDSERRDIDLGLAFIANLDPEERVALLEVRQAELDERLRVNRNMLAGMLPEAERIPWVIASLEHTIVRVEAESSWNRSLLDRVATFPPRDWNRPLPDGD